MQKTSARKKLYILGLRPDRPNIGATDRLLTPRELDALRAIAPEVARMTALDSEGSTVVLPGPMPWHTKIAVALGAHQPHESPGKWWTPSERAKLVANRGVKIDKNWLVALEQCLQQENVGAVLVTVDRDCATTIQRHLGLGGPICRFIRALKRMGSLATLEVWSF